MCMFICECAQRHHGGVWECSCSILYTNHSLTNSFLMTGQLESVSICSISTQKIIKILKYFLMHPSAQSHETFQQTDELYSKEKV